MNGGTKKCLIPSARGGGGGRGGGGNRSSSGQGSWHWGKGRHLELWRRHGVKIRVTLSGQRLLRLFLLLCGLSKVNLHVASSLVRASEATAASVASERLLSGVGADMGGEVVGTREVSHADATLERFLAGVRPHVTGELVGTREASGTGLDRAAVGSLARRCLGPFREMIFTLHLHDTAAGFGGSVVVHERLVRQLSAAEVVVVVVAEEVVRCRVQKLVEVRVQFEVRGELIGVADERPLHVHGGGGLKVRQRG